VPHDIETLRQAMRRRAEREQAGS